MVQYLSVDCRGVVVLSCSRFKPRKNSEPKIGPDGQPRLNARQRRTLRRARERALKGLLEVSQALLAKAEVPVSRRVKMGLDCSVASMPWAMIASSGSVVISCS